MAEFIAAIHGERLARQAQAAYATRLAGFGDEMTSWESIREADRQGWLAVAQVITQHVEAALDDPARTTPADPAPPAAAVTTADKPLARPRPRPARKTRP